MNELDMFLEMPNISELTEEICVSKRLGKMTIKALDSSTYDEFSKASRTIKKKGKIEFDTNKFNLLLLNECIIKPEFANAEFLSKVKCATAKDFFRTKFLPGEIQEIANRIIELSGFETDINDEIEEAKN